MCFLFRFAVFLSTTIFLPYCGYGASRNCRGLVDRPPNVVLCLNISNWSAEWRQLAGGVLRVPGAPAWPDPALRPLLLHPVYPAVERQPQDLPRLQVRIVPQAFTMTVYCRFWSENVPSPPSRVNFPTVPGDRYLLLSPLLPEMHRLKTIYRPHVIWGKIRQRGRTEGDTVKKES